MVLPSRWSDRVPLPGAGCRHTDPAAGRIPAARDGYVEAVHTTTRRQQARQGDGSWSPSTRASAFRRLQSTLAAARAATAPGTATEHVVVSLPSHSMPQRLLDHHASLLPGLEHRALVDGLRTARSPGARVVVVTSEEPPGCVLDCYAALARPEDPEGARRRISSLVVPDAGARGVAAKLLGWPDLVEELRRRVGGAPAVIEPWNVTDDEVDVALALGVPLDGSPPDLWSHGFKSASRRLFREAGVPVPLGVEDVHDATEVAAAVAAIRRDRPSLEDVIVKLDNSGAGEGNWTMATNAPTGQPLTVDQLAAQMASRAPEWFLADLASGGVVEELVTGEVLTSPSAQAEIRPDGEVVVLATHEQVLGGGSGQVFLGSRLPADPAYAAELTTHVTSVACVLSQLGAVGWLTVDFVARRGRGGWALAAVDLNLRRGGTTHSYTALRYLVPGSYDPRAGRWVADSDGSTRTYRSGDAVEVLAGRELSPERAITSLEVAGLGFDHARGAGVLLHGFPSLASHGAIGVTAIARTSEEAERLFAAVPPALGRTADRRP